ncbi:hypothetical protein PanWU01x14_025330 [Parasponia andersonii]|uniref:Uncharacterized protein n=1 Tax=Parasponia andersonii TaxID=3476 RepID=A0A2P5DWV7_PARAD|nr:hypothetical protein PanWU01x14_025330 [Parasponia andersonii]
MQYYFLQYSYLLLARDGCSFSRLWGPVVFFTFLLLNPIGEMNCMVSAWLALELAIFLYFFNTKWTPLYLLFICVVWENIKFMHEHDKLYLCQYIHCLINSILVF